VGRVGKRHRLYMSVKWGGGEKRKKGNKVGGREKEPREVAGEEVKGLTLGETS